MTTIPETIQDIFFEMLFVDFSFIAGYFSIYQTHDYFFWFV